MDLSRSLYVAYIEEDDEQRSLFRVRPLLGTQGLVTQEDLDELGDDGYLRIVPDKVSSTPSKTGCAACSRCA